MSHASAKKHSRKGQTVTQRKVRYSDKRGSRGFYVVGKPKKGRTKKYARLGTYGPGYKPKKAHVRGKHPHTKRKKQRRRRPARYGGFGMKGARVKRVKAQKRYHGFGM